MWAGIWGCLIGIMAHWSFSHVDLWNWVERCWLLSMVLLTSWPLDLHWWTLGMLGVWVYGESSLECCTGKQLKKQYGNYKGIWELNLGPNDYQPTHINHYIIRLFVSRYHFTAPFLLSFSCNYKKNKNKMLTKKRNYMQRVMAFRKQWFSDLQRFCKMFWSNSEI